MEALWSGAVAAAISAVGAVYAARAARYSRPTGNGFAQRVKDDLQEIKNELRDLKKESKEDWRYHYDTHHK